MNTTSGYKLEKNMIPGKIERVVRSAAANVWSVPADSHIALVGLPSALHATGPVVLSNGLRKMEEGVAVRVPTAF